MTQTVAVLGTGKIGEALLSGMIRAGWAPADLLVTARRPERAEELRARYGVEAVTNAEAAKSADTLILTVKPQDMGTLLDELAPHVPADRLVISAAAGIPTSFFEERLAAGTPVVRVMTEHPRPRRRGHVRHLGGQPRRPRRTSPTPRRSSAASARPCASRSPSRTPPPRSPAPGPAYFYYLVEAMTDAGILLGLPRDKAHDLIVQAAIGAAVMLRDSGEHPVKLREAVTSPAGTTISAIRELENHGVRAALIAALEAARDRSRELASGNG